MAVKRIATLIYLRTFGNAHTTLLTLRNKVPYFAEKRDTDLRGVVKTDTTDSAQTVTPFTKRAYRDYVPPRMQYSVTSREDVAETV